MTQAEKLELLLYRFRDAVLLGEPEKDHVEAIKRYVETAQDRVLTVDEACKTLSCSRTTLYKWAKGRDLPLRKRQVTRGKKPQPFFYLQELLDWQEAQICH